MNIQKMKFPAVLAVIFSLSLVIAAQSTAFNYQGKLTDAGTPQAIYQMEFRLFGSAGKNDQIGATVTNENVAVAQGIFSVLLDFGANVFTGADRFLEIAVRRNAGETYTILSPREKIASSPYSIRTLSAEQSDLSLDSEKLGGIPASEYVTNTTVGSSFIRNAATLQTGNFNINGNGFVGGNFGIGTTTPTSKFQVQANGYGITQTNGTVTIGSFISSADGGSGWFGTRSNNPLIFFTNDSLAQMTLLPSGNVGIGITNPTARLQVLSTMSGSTGIFAESSSGRAIWGKSTTSRGVYGESDSLEGIYGISSSGAGVAGRSTNNSGVYGESAITNGLFTLGAGVYGIGTGSTGSVGVYGAANNGNGVGVFGSSISPTGYAIFARNNGGGRAIYAEGNVGQNLSGNGVVKAMAYIQYGGGLIPTLVRCYNAVTNSSSGNCGFSYGTYSDSFGRHTTIDFGFKVDDRFISATGFGVNVASVWTFSNTQTVDILTRGNGGSSTNDCYIFVY